MKKRRIEIVTLKDETFIIRNPAPLLYAWCAVCRAEVGMLTPEMAAPLANMKAREIYRRVEAGTIHFLETPEGRLWICLNSLPFKHEGADFL